jgi:hypothetical protein
MGSLIEELQRREAAARQEADELRSEIARLSERLARAEEALARLEVTRETVTEILGDAGAGQAAGAAGPVPAGGSPIGAVTVPPWRPGLAQSVLPASYQDLLEVLADAGRPLRAGAIAAAAGLGTDKAKIEGLRSKLDRLAGRGWLAKDGAGCSRCPATRRRTRHARPPRAARRALLPKFEGANQTRTERRARWQSMTRPRRLAPSPARGLALSPWRRTFPAAGPGR